MQYLIAGYAFALIIVVGVVVSLIRRYRALAQEMRALNEEAEK